ncbi:hypothetical protein GI374_08690 [Paracoccus sp. S-4012]|uniref:MliC family protein n=1 Tax=Paracoccus sp. S-4012 TaxID=2665648 RepID=UPI0012AFF275|nr:MliC family protein [Paracoccus sp. S-4012]MRX50517.1 hypothetical protein [Paracoccus sp. S-4012]
MTRLAFAALAATTAHAEGDQFLHVTYHCPSGAVLEAVFINTTAGDSHAVVTRGEGLMPMSQAISGSGARYTSVEGEPPFTFWTKGDQASLYEGPDETPLLTDCIAR